ncbi:high mobility group B protein 14 isoform X2 [Aristolochia californica]|uniref:high mobility group B protein 14 isoform X2 n=1 Tax=Aristolochia californica TaxID=171875 RepID=UPI0035DF31F7
MILRFVIRNTMRVRGNSLASRSFICPYPLNHVFPNYPPRRAYPIYLPLALLLFVEILEGKSSDAKLTRSSKMKKNTKQRKAAKTENQLQSLKPKPKVKPKPKKKLTREELDKPKKPPTAFFYFLEDFRKSYQEEHPDVKSMRDIGKACGEKWKTMSFEEKVKYYDIATEKRQDFEDAMTAYIKKKQSDEDYEGDMSD